MKNIGMKNIGMKNIGMKKNINEQREGIWGESLKSLKSLKSLMQIFAESANSANSAKQIFATFATFATFAMQIFHKGSYSAVRVSSVQQPTNIQRISNLSLTIRPILPLFATLVMLTFGGWNSMAWGATSSVNTANLWETSTDDANDRVVWTAPNVTFKLHNNGDGGNIELYLNDHILIQKNKTYKLEWEVADGYTIEVQRVSVRARSTLKSYITVGSTTSGNIYGSSYTTVTSEALSLGNDGYVTIRPNQGADGRDDAIVHMDDITVTYTFSGLTYTVRFNANLVGASGSMSNQSFSFDESKALTANAFSKSGYKFLGWTTNINGTGTFYEDKESVVNLSSTNSAIVDLYAKWTSEQTVTFNDGKFSKTVGNVTFYLQNDAKKHFQWYDGIGSNDYYWVEKSDNSNEYLAKIFWAVPAEGYTIAVSKLSFHADAYLAYTGRGYLATLSHTYPDVKFYDASGGKDIEISSTSYSSLFPTGSNSIGNTDYFQFKNTGTTIAYTNIKLTYTITPNEHTITLDDNGGHGGDGTHKVTYDAATGSLTNAPTLLGYTLEGYYTSGGTKIFNADKSVVSGVSTYTDGSGNWIKDDDVELSAHWTANSYTITLNNQGADTGEGGTANIVVTFDANTYLPSSIDKPKKTDHIFDGYYTGENGTGTKIIEADGSIIASAGDDTYTDSSKNWKYAGNITLYANWTSKATPRFTPDGFSSASTNAIYVGDVLSLTVADVSGGLDGHFTATYDEDYFSVTRDGNTISIEALNAVDGKTVVFTQTENSSIFGATETYTFNVSKVANTMTIKDDCEKYVGQELTDVIGNINSNGTITTTSSAAGIAHYDIDNDKIVVDNASAVQFGASQDVTIIINQAATYKYTAANETIVVTVKKYPNAITSSWGEWSKNLNFDEEAGITFSSNNDTGTPIVVTPSPASSVATYDGTNNKIVANYHTGEVVWAVSQAEDYKYQAATTQNCTITVGTASSPDCITLHSSTPDTEASNVGIIGWNKDSVASQLQFDMKKKVFGGNLTLSRYINGSWTDNDTTISTSATKYGDGHKTVNLPAKTTKIKFGKGGSDDPYVNNIVITRRKYFDIKNAAGSEITSLEMPKRTASAPATTNKFYVHFSTCATKVKLASDNSHIIFANGETTYEFNVDSLNKQEITLSYTSSEAETISDAKVYIYTEYEHKTITVNAQTKGKLSTTLEYIGADNYAVNADNIAATSLFRVVDENDEVVASPVIKLISSDSTKIDIVHVDGKDYVDFLCGDNATITAIYAGDETYAAASNLSRTITVNKLSDAIVWNNVRAEDGKIHVWADTVLTATMASANTGITYTIEGGTNVSVEGSTYTITTPGEVTLRATSAGDCTYASATDTKKLVVDSCEQIIIWEQDFSALPLDASGEIDFNATLNAYAVDSTGKRTNVAISYTMPEVDFAHITKGTLYVTDAGTTTITATTAASDKYATVSRTIQVHVLTPGELISSASGSYLRGVYNESTHSSSWSTEHVTFTFSGGSLYMGTIANPYFYITGNWSYDKEYVLSWTVDDKDANGNSAYDIKVTKLTLDIERASGRNSYIRVGNGDSIGNIYNSSNIPAGGVSSGTMNEGEGGFIKTTYYKCGDATSNIKVNNIKVYYTLTPIINKRDESVEVTICKDNKHLVNLSECASLTEREGHLSLSYVLTGENAGDAHITEDKKFYADKAGSYRVIASVPEVTNCHNGNAEEFTITVTPAALELTAPTASDITYRQTLSESALTSGAASVGGCAVAGTWAWAAPATVPSIGDDQPFAVTFTPSENADNYTNFGTTALVDVKRAQFIFDGLGEEVESQEHWKENNNWVDDLQPQTEDIAIIRHDVKITEKVSVYSMEIEGESKVIIAPTGGLTVGAGGITGATKDNLKLQAGTTGETKGQTGYLRISPEYAGTMPSASVEFFNMTYFNTSTNEAELQCVGAPIVNVKASTVFPAGSYLYTWDEENDTWVSARTKLTFEAFKGFDVTQRKAAAGFGFEYAGQLISVSDEKTINLSHSGSGHNLLANSFTAPISIEEFESTDFSNANQTIYILNAGTKAQSHEQEGGVDAPGKWVGVPIKTASELAEEGYPTMIAPMQGFWIVATGDDAQLKLDYSRLVWDVTYSGVNVNKPLRAPKRNGIQDNEKAEITGKLKVNVYSVRENDVLFMLESPSFDTSYEDGYDAHKIASGSLDVYTLEDEGELGIDATNSIIGTRIGVRTGGETAYTMSFERVVNEKDMVLWDTEADEKVEIREGQTYTFFAEPNSEITGRFIIVEAEAPEIATGIEEATTEDAKVHKFIKDDKLYILKNGVLYDATGMRVQ